MSEHTNKGFWERFAFLYTRFMKKNDRTYEAICHEITPLLHSDMSVLELACGTGQLSFRLCDRVKNWLATDYSPNMIGEAKKNRAHTNIQFSVADATDLSYDAHSFDAVVIANALHIMPEPEVALKEVRRVLKPNGILFAPTFVYEPGYQKIKIWLMEKVGFHTFHKWTAQEFAAFVMQQGYAVEHIKLLKGNPLSECFLVGRISDRAV
ncbi:MAG: class I SAM-dependent methyltransferase [Eubacteriales bacterium]|nr:class I SAM-dependent methyltransferase [Eubacteriales bacterium]